MWVHLNKAMIQNTRTLLNIRKYNLIICHMVDSKATIYDKCRFADTYLIQLFFKKFFFFARKKVFDRFFPIGSSASKCPTERSNKSKENLN